MKIVYECESCNVVLDRKTQIKQCPVCGADVCKNCSDHVPCALTRLLGHKTCFVKEDGEFYEPGAHSIKACKVCGLIYCDCEK